MLPTDTSSSVSVPVQRKSASLPEPLRFGRPVVYYNRWTGWNEGNKETTAQYFRLMTPEELRALKSGDLIWVDVQPHPNGKVYGYVPMLVVRTEIDEARKEIRVYFGQGSSIASLKLGCGYKFRAVDDLDALATFVRVNPDCLKVSTSSDLVPVLI